ncbi:MAG: Ribosome-binding factor A [Phycisphaerae bacterium]|nr:Ribosome-binding factor A [Phycisphaerae bacterium]
MSRRIDKMASLVRHTLAELINYRLNDPRISVPVTVTAVDLSPDLRQAIVKVTALGATDAQLRTLLRGLRHASGRLSRMLGDRMDSKTVPHLDIRIDEQAIRTQQTLEAIRKAMEETPGPAPEVEPSREKTNE